MIKVGLTGGIGSGKSTVAKIFQALGYPVYIADTRAKELMVKDSELVSSIKKVFGEDIYSSNGTIDRQKLASIVFKDKKALEKLNSLVHPAVKRDFKLWCTRQDSSIVFEEAAILFETGSDKYFDKTILVTASKEERIRRVINRDQTTREAVESRMANQWSQEKKIQLADYIINNEGDELVIPQVLKLIQDLKPIS